MCAREGTPSRRERATSVVTDATKKNMFALRPLSYLTLVRLPFDMLPFCPHVHRFSFGLLALSVVVVWHLRRVVPWLFLLGPSVSDSFLAFAVTSLEFFCYSLFDTCGY